MEEWQIYANIAFNLDPQNSVVRIAFDPDSSSGSWSYVATECLEIPRDEPTMNLSR